MAKILVIEDDSKTANAICNGLRTEGYETAVARTGEEGDSLLRTERFDLVVLDWMLPGRDGIEILKTLRARGARTPVLLLYIASEVVASVAQAGEVGAQEPEHTGSM